jgi:hypothetical protein
MCTKEEAEGALEELQWQMAQRVGDNYAIETVHFVRDRIATLTRQLAESYAPCRECVYPPEANSFSRDDSLVIQCSNVDCNNGGVATSRDIFECRDAWNEAQRKK